MKSLDPIKQLGIEFQTNPCIPEEKINHPDFFLLITESGPLYLSLGIAALVILPQGAFFILSIFWYLFTLKSKSRATTRLQKQLFFAMCLQVAIPISAICIPAGYCVVVVVVGYYNQGKPRKVCRVMKPFRSQ